MRVFLKVQAGPIATAGAGSHAEPPRTNGNGGSHPPNGEASAFRELLTEFRNLTERYGQALLALGESRGEVAGLRSRVDLLEARLDLRLPPARDEAPIAWEAQPPLPSPEATARGAALPEPVGSAPVERPMPRARSPRKTRSSKAAVAGFAEALARAQDPTVAEVRAAPEVVVAAAEPPPAEPAAAEASLLRDDAQAAVDALQDAFEVAAPQAAPAFPPDTKAAEDTAPGSPYRADVVEPDWFADGDFAWLDVAEMEARTAPAAAAEESIASAKPAAEPEPEPETKPEPLRETDSEPPDVSADAAPVLEPVMAAAEAEPAVVTPWEPAPEAVVAPEPTPLSVADPEPKPETSRATSLEAVPITVEPRPEAGPGPRDSAPELPALSVQPAAGEEELMWLGGRQEVAVKAVGAPIPAQAAAPAQRPRTVAAAAPHGVVIAWPATDRSGVEEPRTLALGEDELARLARDEGWDAAEVAAIRAMIGASPAQSIELPGAEELDVAMAALDSAPVRPEEDPSREWAKAARERDEPSFHEEWAYESEPSPPPVVSRLPNTFDPLPARRPTSDPGWLRSRRGPAATAYRRLRRLFPG